MDNRKLKSYLWYYIAAWALFSLGVSIVRLTAPNYLLGSADHIRFQIVVISLAGMAVFLGSINYAEWKRMANYLEEKHGIQTHFSNVWLSDFLKSKENYNDSFVDELKNNYRLICAFTFIAFIIDLRCIF